MNQEDIIRMARKAGIAKHGLGVWEGQLERFADLAFAAGAAAEREVCAKVCETMGEDGYGWVAITATIRARGEK